MTDSFSAQHILDYWHDKGVIADPALLYPFVADATPQSFASDETVVAAGNHSNHLFFVHSGLLRLYYLSPEGKERNKAFYGPGHFVGAVSAAITQSTAPFSIAALEPTQVVTLDFHRLYESAPEHPALSKNVIALLSEAFIRNEQREAILLTGNAEQRYKWLQDNEPELLRRVPQFHIASYLGVDAVSLSRLKGKLKRN
ncbi:MAG: Crp/Fnr family transcriptional regulator [Halieaceae bacterium]